VIDSAHNPVTAHQNLIMHRLIKELRRREVFRTVGLYVGISWILIEASSVMLPAFDAPDWALRAVIIVAIIGLPVAVVLAWFYDVTESGIEVQADPTDTVILPFGGRKTDFAVIGVLVVALVFSVYMNVTGTRTVVAVELEPVSVLIADFDNQTGDAMFDGLLEQALTIGVESAPHISAYLRTSAKEISKTLNEEGRDELDEATAQLVAAREGVRMVLAGSIIPAGAGYELAMSGLDLFNHEQVFDVSVEASSRNDVLTAIGELSAEVREALGDDSLKGKNVATVETFTASSIEAARDYVSALALAYDGKHDEAIELYRSATEKDPSFGRAFSGWALSTTKLGKTEEADKLWKRALTLLGTMTERERLRTLGLYYTVVTGNYEKAVESFGLLVDKFPSDAAGRNNLQVVAFLTLDFQRASDEGIILLQQYPDSALYRSNFALLATYSGDFEEADRVAKDLIEDDPDYAVSYLAVAAAAMYRGEFDEARGAYQQMLEATKSEYGQSAGTIGLADVESYLGNYAEVRQLLEAEVESAIADGNTSGAASKLVIIAETYLAEGDLLRATEAARSVLVNSQQTSHSVAAAMVAIGAGDMETARTVAERLGKELQVQTRAYGEMISASLLREQGDYIAAIDKLRSALEMSDLWLIRLQLGRAYLDGGHFAEAADELRTCADTRIGEATFVFLDDTPTYRYLAELPYWQGRAAEGFGMTEAAADYYQAFLQLRLNGGPLADDASERIAQ
jgi:tetratricopeptide (TPR) repeat protein